MTYASGTPLSTTERTEFAAERKRAGEIEIARQRACPRAERYTRATPAERIAARRLEARILGDRDAADESR